MQAYDLVTRRSTAPCRIVGIAAASEGEAVAAVIGKHKDQARQAGTRDGTGHKQRVIRQNENPARVRFKGRGLGNPHNGFRGERWRAPLGKHLGERRPINVANSPI